MNMGKRILSILLVLSIVLSGCGSKIDPTHSEENHSLIESTTSISIETTSVVSESLDVSIPADDASLFSDALLNDPDLLRYIEDSAYQQLVVSLNSADFFVENVQATYISNEYLQELEYNSRANAFFGYTLSDLDKQFQNTKYVFTFPIILVHFSPSSN